MKKLLLILIAFSCSTAFAQNKMTPELLMEIRKGYRAWVVSKDGQYALYSVSTPNAAENKSTRKTYAVLVTGGEPIPVSNADSMLKNDKISSDGKFYHQQ